MGTICAASAQGRHARDGQAAMSVSNYRFQSRPTAILRPEPLISWRKRCADCQRPSAVALNNCHIPALHSLPISIRICPNNQITGESMKTLLSSVSRLALLAATPLLLIQAAGAASDPIALPT